MNDTRTVIRQDMGSATPSECGLPPDLMAKARTRIAGLAGVLGALSLMAILLNTTLFREDVDSAVLPQHLLAVGLAWVVLVTARSKQIADMTALSVGLVYEVVLCWIVSFSSQHAAVVLFGRPPEITWTSMIIVVFPMVVPLPPSRLLVASILAAVSSPGALLVLDHMDKHALSIDELVSVSISPAFAVVLAYFGSRMIYAVSLDVSRARLMGAYRLESRIGSGGMGEVWRARHSMLARPAAIKLIPPERLGDDAYAVLTRFEQEAQATASLRSPHTVELYDFGRAADGSFYYVMELLVGLDLSTLVESSGPQEPARVIHLLVQACHSLEEAHRAGLIHRDIKPANLFACRYGTDDDFVKVLDFGMVKTRQDPGRHSVKLTADHSVFGTPSFMAPEQVLGKADIDGRTDIYALGCVAYWLLTGRYVFQARTAPEMMALHLREPPEPPSALSPVPVPGGLEELILMCLEKDRDQRPQSANELANRLLACQVEPAWTPERAREWWDTQGATAVSHYGSR